MIKYIEVEFEKEYGICILATHMPTLEEIKTFCKNDMKLFEVSEVLNIAEISKEEACLFYDMSNENNFPILQ